MKQVFVVTGAGSGMGYEIAKMFGKQGTVVLCGRTLSKIESAVEKLKALGIDAHGISCDVTSKDSVAALAKFASDLGEVRVVVNNAGVSPEQGGSGKAVYQINLGGVVNVTDAFYPLMGEGSILINIASMAGYMMPLDPALEELFAMEDIDAMIDKALSAYDEMQAYVISKVFVIDYTKKLCLKFAQKKARVVSVSPGTFDTPLLESSGPVAQQMVQATPVGRVGDPVEIAYLVEFLASDKAGFITGTDILIDGGCMNVVAQSMKQQMQQQ